MKSEISTRKERILETKKTLGDLVDKKPLRRKRMKETTMRQKKISENYLARVVSKYSNQYGDLLIDMGNDGYSITVFTAFLFNKLFIKVSQRDVSKWLRLENHFKISYEIYKGKVEMWQRDKLLNPPKIVLEAGIMHKKVDKSGKVTYEKDSRAIQFKEEQLKQNLFNKSIELQQSNATIFESINGEDEQEKKITFITPNNKESKEWETKYIKDQEKNKVLIDLIYKGMTENKQ